MCEIEVNERDVYLAEEWLTFVQDSWVHAGSNIKKLTNFESSVKQSEYHNGTRRIKDENSIHLK